MFNYGPGTRLVYLYANLVCIWPDHVRVKVSWRSNRGKCSSRPRSFLYIFGVAEYESDGRLSLQGQDQGQLKVKFGETNQIDTEYHLYVYRSFEVKRVPYKRRRNDGVVVEWAGKEKAYRLIAKLRELVLFNSNIYSWVETNLGVLQW